MKRAHFLQQFAMICCGFTALGLGGCKKKKTNKSSTLSIETPFKLSLAQWSLNKAIRFGGMSPYDFAKKASNLGFTGLEYVAFLYKDVFNSKNKSNAFKEFIYKSNSLANQYGLDNVLIMVDGEGNLSDATESSRLLAINNHKHWVDAAAAIGCHSIRVNLYGTSNHEQWKTASKESLSALAEYASPLNINILIENHGGFSSNAKFLMEVINDVNANNCGTLPDFGNFCVKKEEEICVESYDKYLGVQEMLPKAGAVSAKSYDFDENGNETTIDYKKMMNLVKTSGYTGYIGVEYEGHRLSEEEGILHTKSLLEKLI